MQHPVYPDMNEKEKIFGGILTAPEFAWIVSFLILGVLFGLLSVKAIGAIGLIVAVPFCIFGLFMAFYKKHDMSLFKYLRLKHKHKKRPKEFPNKRKGIVLTMSSNNE